MGRDRYTGSEDEYETGGELVDLAEQPEVDTGASAVATAPGSRILVMVAVGLGLLGFLYYMFFTGDEEKKEAKKAEQQPTRATIVAPPVTPDTSEVTTAPVPRLPEVPPITLPEPPEPPKSAEAIPLVPTPPPLPTPVAPAETAVSPPPPVLAPQGESEEAKQRRLARLKSGIILVGGGGPSGGAGATTGAPAGAAGGAPAEGAQKEGALEKLFGKKAKPEFGNVDFSLDRTSAAQANATLTARDMSAVVAQGKVIDAILETAINTDIPGQLRAIISRDVYAETGKNILLPKGTRLVGNYQAEIRRGDKRVQIIWTRAIRPDGVDIAIDSPGTDQLGRSGVDGIVDNRYFELFSNAILLTTVTAGAAMAAEAITGTDGISSTTSLEGTTTQSGKPSDFALMEGIQNMGDITTGIGQDLMRTKPTITVDQGTRIKVFVNRDLIFPASVANNVKFVQ